jgi:hypothetical protein
MNLCLTLTTSALALELWMIYRTSLRERIGFDDEWSRDVLVYLSRLRDFATEAAMESKGLVFCRYEDW